MGNCCASGTREGTYEQKEYKLASPEQKKDEEPILECRARPAADQEAEHQEDPDDTMFRNVLKKIKSPNTKTNVLIVGIRCGIGTD